LGCVATKRKKKKPMAKESGRSDRGESACTFEMLYNRKETKAFNAREKVRAMARMKERTFVEGKQHTQVWEMLQ
jgi:hypothetical protein